MKSNDNCLNPLCVFFFGRIGTNGMIMKPKDRDKLLAWTARLVALRSAAKGTTKYQEALALKAELMERAEKREEERNKGMNMRTPEQTNGDSQQ